MKSAFVAFFALIAIIFSGCGQTAAEACREIDPQAKVMSGYGDDDEKLCELNGRPVGEIDDGGMGWEVDDDD